MAHMSLLPPPKHLCPVCAVEHEAHLPHNRDSLYYQIRFKMLRRREPTWADAAAHCHPVIQKQWRETAERMGVQWTTPADGDPIADPPAESLHQLTEREEDSA